MTPNETPLKSGGSDYKLGSRENPKVLKAKIFVIDDEQIMIDVITAYLREAGFENVKGTTDSIDAVQRMHEVGPDLMLMDISMPDVSGNYLLQIARKDPVLRSVPVIIVTADESEVTRRKALEYGANDVLTKPLSPEALVGRVESTLSRKLASDATAKLHRHARNVPVNEKYNQLRNLAGRSDGSE